MKQDFSSNIVKEGKDLFEGSKVVSAKILEFDIKTLRISAQVMGQFENTYECEIEIDRLECETIDSNCDCPYHYDCQHLAAVLFFLENNLDQILVHYSKEADLNILEKKEEIIEVVKIAEGKEEKRMDEEYQKQLLHEYVDASDILSKSPFFLTKKFQENDQAELALIYQIESETYIDIQLALRLPSRSKPLHISSLKEFLDSVCYREPHYIGSKQYLFTLDSFPPLQSQILKFVLEQLRFDEKKKNEKGTKSGTMGSDQFGVLLSMVFEAAKGALVDKPYAYQEEDKPQLPCFFENGIETPLLFSISPARFQVGLEFIEPPATKILLNPKIMIPDHIITLKEAKLFESPKPGLIYENAYYRFEENINRQHLHHLLPLRDMTLPEPLFGTFVENALPVLSAYADIENQEVIEKFVTLPYVGSLNGVCDLSYLDGELEAELSFIYDGKPIPALPTELRIEHLEHFVTDGKIVARNLVAERAIIEDLFQDFVFNKEGGTFIAKSEKKIVEFMTDVIPRNSQEVTFNCPQNLLDQFIYDESTFTLALSHKDRMDEYEINLMVHGDLKGVMMDRLLECLVSKRPFIELEKGKGEKLNKIPKILVLDLDRIGQVIQLFDELGIEKLNNHKLSRPLWSLANIDKAQFKGLPVKFSMTRQLINIRKQMLGDESFEFSAVPEDINATLRHYQVEGVNWLERLRSMYLNGILADDMGLGKTLQAIVALTQYQNDRNQASMIICPTSLLYNWKKEFSKFNDKLKILVIDGIPSQRKRLIESIEDYDIVVTSYSLLQKDIEAYEKIQFSYLILDEAQHIKNRGTRNAKSVKLVKADHRLILSGTPIENSLQELWSLFDFLMPGFLNSYDRFVEKYIRATGEEQSRNLQYLRKKVSPFILRRMKSDVLDDLPPVSELVYHCQLSNVQEELYKSYAESARNELVRLVERDGFDKVQIHVLATLTRLKQICCHPAIFAKESKEPGDSAKYDMLLELLQTLIEGGHKTVIFSQYTKMLQIMREDFNRQGIRYSYLDGSSKDRLQIVEEFNQDPNIPIFLVSLKAGGTGLNIVGADTVIHYDMWWNPAVENQATDRVHRMGQQQAVSVYKLVTIGTIEEKILKLQNRKKGLVKKVVSCDDEAISKLTWEDVLELLQT
ncbi:MAG: SNF2-related protein [Simkaniaceae bacterium]